MAESFMDRDRILDPDQLNPISMPSRAPPSARVKVSKLIVDHDWSRTTLGPQEDWPSTLTSILDLIAGSRFPHFVAWGDDLNILFNDAFGELLEDPVSALGARIDDLWAPAWPTVGPIIRQAMAGTSSFFEDLPIRTQRAGRWVQTWWTFAYAPIRLPDGRIGGLFGTAMETTRHKQLEHKLQDREKALRRFTDLVPNFLWEGDASGQLFYMNRKMLSYTGVAEGEVVDWSSLVHPDDIARLVAANAEAQARQGNLECQHRFRAANGTYRWFLSRAHPVFDEEGGVASWYGCATDIHNWRLTVDELRKSETLVRRFAENAARILWIADLASGRVEYLNSAGRLFWDGEPGREIRGWDDWLAMTHPSHQPLILDAVDRLRAGETVTGVYRVADREGRFSHLRTTLFPIIDDDGALERFGGIAEAVDSPRRRLVHLIDADREAHRELATRLFSKGYEVRGFTDVQAFVRVAPALMPGCVLVRLPGDTHWPERVVAAAEQQHGRLRPVVMSERHRDADHVRDLMKAGAADILPYDADLSSIETAIDEAMRPLDGAEPRETEPGGDSQRQSGEKLANLSVREREILERLTGGATNKVVALDLGISPRTVEAHRARIFEKLGVSSLAQAVAITVSKI